MPDTHPLLQAWDLPPYSLVRASFQALPPRLGLQCANRASLSRGVFSPGDSRPLLTALEAFLERPIVEDLFALSSEAVAR
ncbi:hypothetical protein ACYZT7_01390 [Pseudomonas sp. RT4P38]